MRTPAEAPVRGKDFGALQDAGEVVHRFAHAHVDDVGELAKFGDGEYLVEYVRSREVTMEALLPRDAETTTHLTAYLTGDAEGGAVAVGYIDGFDKLIKLRIGFRTRPLFRGVVEDRGMFKILKQS